MQALLRRLVRVPLRHLLLASGIGLAIGIGFWVWSSQLPINYVSSALLSYETPHRLLDAATPPDSQAPTVRIAESVLTPAELLKIATQLQFVANASSDSGGSLNASSVDVKSFRSHYALSQPAPGFLQITYRGQDLRQVEASINTLASTLAAWVPAPPAPAVAAVDPVLKPAPPEPSKPAIQPAAAVPAQLAVLSDAEPTTAQKRKAAELRRRADVLDENVATLALQRQTFDSQILKLVTEEKGLKRSAAPAAGASDKDSTRRQLETQLATAKQRLKELSQSYGDDYPDVEAVKARVTSLEQRLASLPPASSARPADSAAHANPAANQAVNQNKIAAIHKSLAQLRGLSAMVTTEWEADKKQVESLRSQAATVLQSQTVSRVSAVSQPVAPAASVSASAVPQVHATPAAQSAAQNPIWLGHFTVLSWGGIPRSMGDGGRQRLIWLGVAAGLAFAAMYLTLAVWRFRPVTNTASLPSELPSDVKYFGAISGAPLMENPS